MSKLETNTIDTVSGTSTLQVGSTNTSTITLGVSGDTINVPSGVTIANSGTATGFGGANTPAFEALITSEQNPSAGADTKINFDNEVFDTASAYSTTDKRFTVPSSQAGKYFIYSSTCIGSSVNSGFNTGDLKIFKNGSDVNRRGHFNTNNDGNGRYYQFSIFNVMDLSVGDYIEMYCYVNAGGTIEIRTQESRFGAYKIIE